jgi:hypothetical protein
MPHHYDKAVKKGNSYKFQVKKSSTSEKVHEFEWSAIPPEGMTEANYLAMMKREMELLVDHREKAETETKLAGF